MEPNIENELKGTSSPLPITEQELGDSAGLLPMTEQELGDTASPLPIPEITPIVQMDFYAAMQRIAEGSKIHKLEWKDEEYYGLMKDGVLTLHKPDGNFYQWVINDGDLNGNDWIIIE